MTTAGPGARVASRSSSAGRARRGSRRRCCRPRRRGRPRSTGGERRRRRARCARAPGRRRTAAAAYSRHGGARASSGGRPGPRADQPGAAVGRQVPVDDLHAVTLRVTAVSGQPHPRRARPRPGRCAARAPLRVTSRPATGRRGRRTRSSPAVGGRRPSPASAVTPVSVPVLAAHDAAAGPVSAVSKRSARVPVTPATGSPVRTGRSSGELRPYAWASDAVISPGAAPRAGRAQPAAVEQREPGDVEAQAGQGRRRRPRLPPAKSAGSPVAAAGQVGERLGEVVVGVGEHPLDERRHRRDSTPRRRPRLGRRGRRVHAPSARPPPRPPRR